MQGWAQRKGSARRNDCASSFEAQRLVAFMERTCVRKRTMERTKAQPHEQTQQTRTTNDRTQPKLTPKNDRKRPNIEAKRSQNRPQIAPGGSGAPPGRSGASRGVPGAPQETPGSRKSSQKTPNWSQKRAQIEPDRSQRAPGRSRDAFAERSFRTVVRETLPERLSDDFRAPRGGRDTQSTRHGAVETHVGRFLSERPRDPENDRKWSENGAQTVPRASRAHRKRARRTQFSAGRAIFWEAVQAQEGRSAEERFGGAVGAHEAPKTPALLLVT